METLHVCPSTLAEGFDTYSPAARRLLFDGREVSHILSFSDTDTVGRKDFEEFGRRIGLSGRLVKRELDFFATDHPLAHELIRRSFLSEKLQHYYWQSFNYRRTTLT